MMSTASERLNFRCRPSLRRAMEEEEKRSGIKISEQARLALERVYDVKEEEEWLPPALRKRDTTPTPSTPVKAKKS